MYLYPVFICTTFLTTVVQTEPTSKLSRGLLFPLAIAAEAYEHVDNRCSCKCPEAETLDKDVNIDWPGRKIYINSTISPTDCDCG